MRWLVCEQLRWVPEISVAVNDSLLLAWNGNFIAVAEGVRSPCDSGHATQGCNDRSPEYNDECPSAT